MSKKLKHGRIMETHEGSGVVVVAIKCETDFLADSDLMRETLSGLCSIIPLAFKPNGRSSIAKLCADAIKELGEKGKEEIKLQECNWHGYYSYHNDLTTNFYMHHDNRKIAVVQVSSDTKSGKISQLCRDIAMHIVAFSPTNTTVDTVDWSQVDLEIPANLTSKPAEIIKKIREGKKKKYAKKYVLMDQPFVKDMDSTVSQIIDEFNKSQQTNVKVEEWHRTEV